MLITWWVAYAHLPTSATAVMYLLLRGPNYDKAFRYLPLNLPVVMTIACSKRLRSRAPDRVDV